MKRGVLLLVVGACIGGIGVAGCGSSSPDPDTSKEAFTPKGVPEGFKNSAPGGPAAGATPPPGATGTR